ncbi:MAG: HEPN domain-containing protein [Candidatus Njordarchaeota archaeon]
MKRNVFAPVHDLIKLAKLIENEYQVKVIENIVSIYDLEVLNIHYILSRYAPQPRGTPERAGWENIIRRYGHPRYDKKVAEEILRIMEKIWDGVRKLGLI